MNKDVRLEFFGVLSEILEKVGICWYGLNSAIYLLHLGAATNETEYFNRAKKYLLEYKELSEKDILFPPSCVSIMEGKVKDYFRSGNVVEIPDIANFSEQCKKLYFKEGTSIKSMVLRALDDDSYIYEWSPDLLEALWSPAANSVN